jgi:hypothetical protein
MVKQIISSAGRSTEELHWRNDSNSTHHGAIPIDNVIPEAEWFPHENMAAFLDLDIDLDFFGLFFPTHGGQMPYWNDFGAPQE